ncbi:MAG: class I SAM-dependent methyltransferase [Gaiellales bacterium]|nr:MAG: class I SAM-dependent methyltransferase [Gaiellales bacterium]
MTELKPNLVTGKEDAAGAYSDGDELEEMLLELLRQEDAPARIEELLAGEPSWPFYYHFTPVRRNLLDWFPFREGASLLEVGCGMGALTGLFCERVARVTAVELTARRARITAWRHRERENLTAIAGNIDGVDLGERFDYVTSIGVLEYAGRYSPSDNPFRDFLRRLGSFLKPGGQLLLAIENRFGFKYWSGAREDHTGRLFESLEGYPGQKDVQTFGRAGLEKLLEEAGFPLTEFYYPVPDFKLPREVFSDRYLPTPGHGIRPGMFPYVDHSQEREHLFNEQLVMDALVAEGTFPFFANSFLVVAGGPQ